MALVVARTASDVRGSTDSVGAPAEGGVGAPVVEGPAVALEVLSGGSGQAGARRNCGRDASTANGNAWH